MKFNDLQDQSADWLRRTGPCGDIVVSSRVRLARNLDSHPFPGWAKKEDRAKVYEKIHPAVSDLDLMKGGFSSDLSTLEPMEKQFLVERHLVSREHAAKEGGCGTVVDEQQNISIMINEEDHLRMQAILPGLDILKAHETIDKIDSQLDQKLHFAFNKDLGYLTSCPSNLGTGMRASAMMHLPGLVLSDRIKQVITASNKIDIAVRGIYGEGTEALANLFQISNQSTLGETEQSILEKLNRIINEIADHERNARLSLIEESPVVIEDKIGRAYGILLNSHNLTSKEALEHLSMLRLGTDIGVINPEEGLMETIFSEIQPAHLQLFHKKTISPEDRDILRADFLRQRLKNLNPPNKLT